MHSYALTDEESGRHYPDQWHFDDVIKGLEKTKDVISRIFG